MAIGLQPPSAAEVMADLSSARAWVRAWAGGSADPFIVETETREWRGIGRQEIPVRAMVPDAETAAAIAGEASRWERAKRRRDEWCAAWPAAKEHLGRLEPVLFDYDDADHEVMRGFIAAVTGRSVAGMLLRQVPVRGMHTKWPEGRRADIRRALSAVTGEDPEAGLEERLGLRSMPTIIHMRVLCPRLRARWTAGRTTFPVADDELGAIGWEVDRLLVVENDQTYHAFDDEEGLVVLLGRGNSIGLLEGARWRVGTALYWGDLDTHGFFILNCARRAFPGIRSILMDEATLLAHRDYWVTEDRQKNMTSESLHLLTTEERAMYEALLSNRHGLKVRLEQERIDWSQSSAAIRAAFASKELRRESRS